MTLASVPLEEILTCDEFMANDILLCKEIT